MDFIHGLLRFLTYSTLLQRIWFNNCIQYCESSISTAVPLICRDATNVLTSDKSGVTADGFEQTCVMNNYCAFSWWNWRGVCHVKVCCCVRIMQSAVFVPSDSSFVIVPSWLPSDICRLWISFFGSASDLYLFLYNQLFALFHYVFKFLTPWNSKKKNNHFG